MDQVERIRLAAVFDPGRTAQDYQRMVQQILAESRQLASQKLQLGQIDQASAQRLRQSLREAMIASVSGADVFSGVSKNLGDAMRRSLVQAMGDSTRFLSSQLRLIEAELNHRLTTARANAPLGASAHVPLGARDLGSITGFSSENERQRAIVSSERRLNDARAAVEREQANLAREIAEEAAAIDAAGKRAAQLQRREEEARGRTILAMEQRAQAEKKAALQETLRNIGIQSRIMRTNNLDPFGVQGVLDSMRDAKAKDEVLAEFNRRTALPFDSPDSTTSVGRAQKAVNDATLRQVRASEALAAEMEKARPDLRRLEAAWDQQRAAAASLSQAQRRLEVVSAPKPQGFVAQFHEGFRGGSDLPYAQQIGQAFKFSVFYGAAYNLLFAFTQTLQATLQEGIAFQEAVSELKLATGMSAEAATAVANQWGRIAADSGFGPSEGVLAGARAVGLYGATGADPATQRYIGNISTEVATQLAFNSSMQMADVQTRLAAITNAFGLGAAGQGRVADLDAYMSKLFGVAPGATISTVAEVGAVGQQAGFNLEEVNAIAALIMGRTGQTDSAVAGQLAQIFSRGGEGSLTAVGQRFGIDSDQTLARQLSQLARIYQTASPNEQNEIAAAFGRGRVQNTISILLGSFEDVTKAANDAAKGLADGASQEAFDERINNIGGQLQLLLGDLKEFANQFGQSGVLASLGLAVAGFGELVESTNGLLSAWNQMDGTVRSVIASLAVLAIATRTQAGLAGLSALGRAGGLSFARDAFGRAGVINAAGQSAAVGSRAGAGIIARGVGSALTSPWVLATAGLIAIGELQGAAQRLNDEMQAASDALAASTDELTTSDQWRGSADQLRELSRAQGPDGFWEGVKAFFDPTIEQSAAAFGDALRIEAERRGAYARYLDRAQRAGDPSEQIITGFDPQSLAESMELMTSTGATARERLAALRDTLMGVGEAADRAEAAFRPKEFTSRIADPISTALSGEGAPLAMADSNGNYVPNPNLSPTVIQSALREDIEQLGIDRENLRPGQARALAEQFVDDTALGLDGGPVPEELADLRAEMVDSVYKVLREQTKSARQMLQEHRELTSTELTEVVNLTISETEALVGSLADSDYNGRVRGWRRAIRLLNRAAAKADNPEDNAQYLLQVGVAERNLAMAEFERLERLRHVAQQNAATRAEARAIGTRFLRREVRRALAAGENGADVLVQIIQQAGRAAAQIVREQLQNAIRVARAAVQMSQSIYEATYYHGQLQELLKLRGVANQTPNEGAGGLGTYAGTDVPGYVPPPPPTPDGLVGPDEPDGLNQPDRKTPEELAAERRERIERMLSIRESLRLLAIDLTDPLAEARVAVQTALDRVKHAVDRESRLAARVDLRRAQIDLEAVKFQQRLEAMQTAEELGRISHLKYINYLESERDRLEAIKKRTYQQQQQLDEVERLLKGAAESMEGQWNFGDIRLPTPYEVRRRTEQLFGKPADPLEWHDGMIGGTEFSRQITINIDGADTGKVMEILRQYLGGAVGGRNRHHSPESDEESLMAAYEKWAESVWTTWLSGKTIKAMLVTPAYEQDPLHTFRSDIVDEVVGTGYTAGGVAVTGVVVTTGTGVVTLDCDPVSFGVMDATRVAGIIFYVSTGNAATDTLIAADLFGSVETDDLVSFTYVPNASGLLIATLT